LTWSRRPEELNVWVPGSAYVPDTAHDSTVWALG
jgi:hypothetical protein